MSEYTGENVIPLRGSIENNVFSLPEEIEQEFKASSIISGHISYLNHRIKGLEILTTVSLVASLLSMGCVVGLALMIV